MQNKRKNRCVIQLRNIRSAFRGDLTLSPTSEATIRDIRENLYAGMATDKRRMARDLHVSIAADMKEAMKRVQEQAILLQP